MNANAFFVGEFVGGFIGIYLLSALLEWAIFKRVFDDPVQGKVGSVVTAWVISVLASIFGGANLLAVHLAAYLVAALAVGALKYRKGLAVRRDMDEAEVY